MASSAVQLQELPEEELLRQRYYRFLASLLRRAPDEQTLSTAASFSGDETPFGRALAALAEAARLSDPKAAAEEYHELFIGIGRGELIPFGSHYITGFLHDRPLAKLRQDMARLGIARNETTKEPEDHIAALLEMMAGFIAGDFGERLPLTEQQAFFAQHLAPWAECFFSDLESAAAASFYRPVGRLGRLFIEIERAGFEFTD